MTPVPQDLHVHSMCAPEDNAVARQQTLEFIGAIGHAAVIGISDHIEFISGEKFPGYRAAVLAHGFHLGTEVGGASWVDRALELDVEYYFYHCPDEDRHYAALERLAECGRPVIVSHPMTFSTNLDRVPPVCLVEINNAKVWRNDWRGKLGPYASRFRWVISSDAHTPDALSQTVARHVAAELGIEETVLFSDRSRVISKR